LLGDELVNLGVELSHLSISLEHLVKARLSGVVLLISLCKEPLGFFALLAVDIAKDCV
jgi:hypothetical protein